ncbi:MAG: hypothetical protein KBT02_10385 [Treponema sp.]|nr:hypothetical protein [Candidatus Treponema caballi]
MSIATSLTALNADVEAAKAAIENKGGTAPNGTADMADAIAAIPSGGITPSGSVTLTEENTYDVTDKAQAIVDFSTTRANLAEAVTAKGVDTLPTASFDTIAVNIGLIEGGGGGGLEKIGTATTDPTAGTGYGQISIPASDGIFLLTNVSVTPNSSNRLPWAIIARIDTTTPAQSGVAFQFNHGSYGFNTNAIRQIDGMLQIDGASAYRFGTTATYDLYKLY